MVVDKIIRMVYNSFQLIKNLIVRGIIMDKKILLLNQKKRLIALATVFTLAITTLTGCNNLKYKTQDNGIVVVTGDIDYNSFKGAKLIHITNDIALIDKYYLVLELPYSSDRYHYSSYYRDIETGKTVYKAEHDDFKNFDVEIVLDGLVDYLYKYDMVKDGYDIEDIKKFKDDLLSDEVLFPKVQSSSKKRMLSKFI